MNTMKPQLAFIWIRTAAMPMTCADAFVFLNSGVNVLSIQPSIKIQTLRNIKNCTRSLLNALMHIAGA